MMDYEKKIRDYMNSSDVDILYKSMLSNLFPELVEPEDERIRKALINYFSDEDESYDGIPYPNIRAWLEKQGEQKPDWSEEDEKEYKYVLKFVDNILNNCGKKIMSTAKGAMIGSNP